MSWAEFFLYGSLMAACAWIAAQAKGEARREGRIAGITLFIVWVLYISAWWPPYNLRNLADWLGFHNAEHMHMWALVDTLAAIYLVIRVQSLWGVALFASLASEGLCHVYRRVHSDYVSFSDYSTALDFGFLTQLAILILIGGRGAVERVRDILPSAFHGNSRHSPSAASTWPGS